MQPLVNELHIHVESRVVNTFVLSEFATEIKKKKKEIPNTYITKKKFRARVLVYDTRLYNLEG